MAAGEDDKKSGHSIADHHGMGPGWVHEHDGYADHDHDDFDMDGPIEENPLWLADNVHLTSVGVDVGSSGTQVVFSRLLMRGPGEPLAMRRQAKSRETLFMSPVAMTPWASSRSHTACDSPAAANMKALSRAKSEVRSASFWSSSCELR